MSFDEGLLGICWSRKTLGLRETSQADDDDGEQRNLDRCGLMSEFSSNKKRKQTSNRQNKVKKKGKGLKDSHFDLGSGPLARVRWFRVVLDEAQTIKNHRTQVARACCGLRAKRRWCLSGTPMQNAIDDLYSYFRFLKYDPYAVYSSFCASIKYPISRNAIGDTTTIHLDDASVTGVIDDDGRTHSFLGLPYAKPP